MHYSVEFTSDAIKDLDLLYDYIFSHDSVAGADYVIDNLEKCCHTLSNFPDRGSYPKELLSLGIKEYREIYFKAYRIVYKIQQKKAYIYLIVDGRRNMQALLQNRLLGTI